MMPNFAPDPRYRLYSASDNYLAFLRFCLGDNKGGQVADLEEQLSRFLDVPFVTCVPQNRVGIFMVIKHILARKKKVIMSPYTIADVVNMVICAGGEPVFADIERDTCNIDPDEIAKLIGPDTGAVLITHLHGLNCDSPRIRELCAVYDVPLIEDAAQSFGSFCDGKRSGTIGHAGVFSFGMYKNVNSFYGGAIVSRDEELMGKIKEELKQYNLHRAGEILTKVKKSLLTDFVTNPVLFKILTFWVFRYGFLNDVEAINKRVRTELDTGPKEKIPEQYLRRYNNFQAELVSKQLPLVDHLSEERVSRARIYHEGLSDLPELIIPPLRSDKSHIYTYFPIQYRERERLIKWMMKHYRDVAAQHYKNCADLPGFSRFYRDCPNARAVSKELIFLPTYPRYPVTQVERNVEVIRNFFKQ
jgi:dTDP-4-amino-4,6-dideoxygalactose transaminase